MKSYSVTFKCDQCEQTVYTTDDSSVVCPDGWAIIKEGEASPAYLCPKCITAIQNDLQTVMEKIKPVTYRHAIVRRLSGGIKFS